MNTQQLRQHLEQVHSAYRAMVDGNRLEDLDRELGVESWMPSTNGSTPNTVVMQATSTIMTELRAAAARRDRSAARSALDRLRRLIRIIDTSAPDRLVRP